MSRYIDADALIEELNSRYGAACNWLTGRLEGNDIEGEIRAMASMGMLIECKKTIEKMPTANVRENVTGKWEKLSCGLSYYTAICSACGERAKAWTVEKSWDNYEYCFPKYCPNCGAKMEGVEE